MSDEEESDDDFATLFEEFNAFDDEDEANLADNISSNLLEAAGVKASINQPEGEEVVFVWKPPSFSGLNNSNTVDSGDGWYKEDRDAEQERQVQAELASLNEAEEQPIPPGEHPVPPEAGAGEDTPAQKDAAREIWDTDGGGEIDLDVHVGSILNVSENLAENLCEAQREAMAAVEVMRDCDAVEIADSFHKLAAHRRGEANYQLTEEEFSELMTNLSADPRAAPLVKLFKTSIRVKKATRFESPEMEAAGGSTSTTPNTVRAGSTRRISREHALRGAGQSLSSSRRASRESAMGIATPVGFVDSGAYRRFQASAAEVDDFELRALAALSN